MPATTRVIPNPGETAPDFEALTDEGKPFRLSQMRGQRFILYFYPKADTPGCTTQACRFRDEYHKFQEKGIAVIGVSPDTVEAQAAFKAKYNLPFTLIADADHHVAEMYNLWGDHIVVFEGTEYPTHGTRRSTFIIDEQGIVQFSKFGVDPANNTVEVLALV